MNEFIINILGTIATWNYSKSYVKYFLDQAKDKPVRIRITSYGGDVNEAIAISKLLEEHGNVTVEFIGFNASAVTWMAFGAKNIEVHEDTFFLVHPCSMSVDIYGSLTSDQLEEKIKELRNAKDTADSINLVIAKKYLDRCEKKGKSIKDVLDLMAESKWMKAEEILEWGFADRILPGINKDSALTNEFRNELMARGLPVPELNPSSNDNGLIATVKGWINDLREEFFNGNPNNKKIEKETVVTMNETYTFVNAVLNVTGVEESQGKVTLTIDQLKSLNEALKKAQEDKAKAEGALDKAGKALDALSDEIKGAEGIDAKVAIIKEVLDKVPGDKVHVGQRLFNDYASIAVDPINRYGEED